MKRWQIELMGVMLLTLVLAYVYRPWDAIKMVLILWLAGRGVFAKAAGEPLLKVAVRIVIGAFAAVGCLVIIDHMPPQHFLPDMPQLFAWIGIAFIPCSCLFVYWLEDAYALVPLKGVGRTILRGALSLILASFAAIGFGIAYIVGCYLVHPVEGPIYSGWIAWVLLFSGFAGPFYATWKLLSLRDHRVPW
jgi:hypothetical protein